VARSARLGSARDASAPARTGSKPRLRPVDPRLLHHAAAARGYLGCAVALGLATTSLVLVQAGLLAHALAGAARGSGLAALAGTLLLLLIVLIGRAVAAYGGEVAALRAAAVVKSQLRRRLVARALERGPSWLTSQHLGEINTLATKGLDGLDAYFARYLPQLLLACVVPVAVLARVTAADWLSGLVIALTLPLIPVFAVLIGLQTKAHTRRQWQLLARLGGHFLDVVEGLPTLKVLGRARAEADHIRAVTSEHRTATMGALRVAFLSALVLELAAAVATALVAVEVGLRLLGGHLGYQTALLVLLLTPEAYLPLRNLGGQFHASVEGTTAAARALEILDADATSEAAQRRSGSRPAPCPYLRTDPIELTGVSLTYPGRAAPALDAVSLTVGPGEHIAITGPSGAGKSSLLWLLLRLAEPTAGRIAAGGTDLADLTPGDWRRQIAWVPQHPYLFAGTIAENIALGAPTATTTAVRAAARLAGVESFARSLPAGLDGRIVERGRNLSAGERQRIAIARALLRDAPVVLLDEPTAHLDPAAARQLLDTLATQLATRTVVLVTHHDRWLGSSYRMMQLDHGRLSPGGGCAVDAPRAAPTSLAAGS
jgi:ATP-binding cassette, subfamily C, bacterial CydD